MPTPTKYYLQPKPPHRTLCAPGGVASSFALSLLMGLSDSSKKAFTTTNSSYETVAVWDIDVEEHQTVDGSIGNPVSVNTLDAVGFFQFQFRIEQIRKSDCVPIAQSPWSTNHFTVGIKSTNLTLTWDKDVPSLLRLTLQLRKTSGASAGISVKTRDLSSFLNMQWDALASLRLQQIAYQAMRRVQTMSGLADARILRVRNEAQQTFPAIHLIDVGYEERGPASLGDGANAKETSAILLFKIYTNEGDPVFDPMRWAKKLISTIEGGSKNLDLSYVRSVESPELVPVKADFEVHKEWGIAVQAFRVVYRSSRGAL